MWYASATVLMPRETRNLATACGIFNVEDKVEATRSSILLVAFKKFHGKILEAHHRRHTS